MPSGSDHACWVGVCGGRIGFAGRGESAWARIKIHASLVQSVWLEGAADGFNDCG